MKKKIELNMEKINLNGIINDSVVDGPGLRTVIFTQGCPHHCKGCHNAQSWSTKDNDVWDVDKLIDHIKKISSFKKVTISGGEPFLQNKAVLKICKSLKEDDFNIYIYSGYVFENLIKDDINLEILKNVDYLVDGPFKEELKDTSLSIFGSTNQRIINIKEKLKEKNY